MNHPMLEFVHGKLDALEQAARAASPGPWSPNAEGDEVIAGDGEPAADGFALSGAQLRATVSHIAAWDPQQVLKTVAAWRKVIELHPQASDETYRCETCGYGQFDDDYETEEGHTAYPCPTVRAIAAVWAGHEGWREEWE